MGWLKFPILITFLISCTYFTDNDKPKELIINNSFNKEQIEIIKRCINRWNDYTTELVGYPLITLNTTIDNEAFDADIHLSDDKNIIYVIYKEDKYYNSVKYKSYRLGSVQYGKADILITSHALDDDNLWLEATVMHELGHWLGVSSHIDQLDPNLNLNTENNLMNSTASEDNLIFKLSDEDIKLFCLNHNCIKTSK
jgi:predicted Zn-dependent protease